jgi:hypothetical protein
MRARQGGFDDAFMHESFWLPERTSANQFPDWLTLTALKKQNKSTPFFTYQLSKGQLLS